MIIWLGVFCLFLSSEAWGQTRGISYQAVARDAGNNLMQNQNLSVVFMIHEATTNGTVVYQEIHNPMTNDFGLFNVVIGDGTPQLGSFSAIAWNSDRHFLEVEVGGQSLGTQEIQSVPYSQVATAMHLNDLVDVDDDLVQINDVLSWDGTEWRATTPSGDTDPNDDITIGAAAGGDLSGTYPDPNVIKLRGRLIANAAPSNGQVLKWDGLRWTPADDLEGTPYGPKTAAMPSMMATFMAGVAAIALMVPLNFCGCLLRQKTGTSEQRTMPLPLNQTFLLAILPVPATACCTLKTTAMSASAPMTRHSPGCTRHHQGN